MTDQPVMLITGTRKGIGRSLAEHYANRGWQVVGCSRKPLDVTIPNYEHFIADVCDESAVKSLFTSVRSNYGHLEVLVNNAGVASMNHSLLMPYESTKNMMDTNFGGTFLFSREAAKLMQKRKFGRIINLSTVAVPLNLEGEAVYAASKAAIEEFTRIQARELADLGITINAIGPTPIETELIRGVPEDKMKQLLNRQAIRRFGQVADLVNLIDFLIRPESSFITGQVIYLGGVA
jgi:3-oxoacyl-[acyl-carrier protein] reductase